MFIFFFIYFYFNLFSFTFIIVLIQYFIYKKRILKVDPYNFDTNIFCLHLSSLVELEKKTELFYAAHKLAEENPTLAISWYAVGCYYFLIGRYESARNYFRKSTTLDPNFGEAW